MYEIIEFLQKSDDYYYIDYIPYEISDVRFLELENYFEKTYLPIYAEKVSCIALKLIYFYSCEIFMTESSIPADVKCDLYNILKHKRSGIDIINLSIPLCL